MNCDEALLAISAALDGELSPKERAELSEHLLACADCRELAEDLRVLTEALERGEQEPPAELADSIRTAVAEEARAAPAPRRRRPPYLRAAAAMLALCVCLGGIGLFASGRAGGKDSADGVAPAVFQAAPESRENFSSSMLEEADGACAESDETAGGGAESPMEAAEDQERMSQPQPSAAPAPAPSCAPDSDGGEGSSSSPKDAAPGEIPNNGGAEKAALTPEEALELVFEYLGGYDEYPEAELLKGGDKFAYYLKTVETDLGIYVYYLDYQGLYVDGQSHWFLLYEDVTGKQEDGFGHTATSNWYTVSPDGEITAEFPMD